MKHRFPYWLIVLLINLLPRLGWGQCPANPTGTLTLLSQAEIDAFPAGCVNFSGTLFISGPDITNLRGLSNLQSVGSSLKIEGNVLTPLYEPVLTGV